MNGKEQRTLRRSEDGIFQRSLFNLFTSQTQKKKSFADKEKRQHSSRSTTFCKGSGLEESKDESGKENGRPKISNSGTEPCMVEQVPSVADSALCYWRVKKFLEKWGKQPNDKVLDLNNCALNAADIMELIAVIPLLPHLEEINLAWNDFIGGALEPLVLQFKHLQELKVLRLNNCRLSAKDVISLGRAPGIGASVPRVIALQRSESVLSSNTLLSFEASERIFSAKFAEIIRKRRHDVKRGEALEVIPCLETLDLSWNNIGGNLSLLTPKIPEGYNLKTFKVTDCNLGREDGESLAQLLKKLHSLEVLDLSINKNIGCSLRSITQELKYVSNLKVLNLHMCGLKQDGFQSLGAAFQHLLELRTLNVSCNKEIGGGFQNSAAHLASLSKLEVLDLHQCCITEEDMAVLTQIIPLLSSLQELNLSSNKSVGVSSDHLLSRLRFLPKLKSLHLSSCLLQQDSFASLAEAASHLPELEILDLSWNKCVGGNLKLILKALNLGAEIQVLRLSSCSLADEDLACLALVMQAGRLPKLQKLDLSYNHHVSEKGWATFYQGLAALEWLTELDVSLRRSSPCDRGEWFGELLAALPKLLKLTELGLQGWVLSEGQQKQLENFNRDNERNICIDFWHGT